MKSIQPFYPKNLQDRHCRDDSCRAPAADFKGRETETFPDWPFRPLVNQEGNKVEKTSNREGLRKEVYRIFGMDCGHCGATLERRLTAVQGVRLAVVGFAVGKLTIEHTLAESEIVCLVKQAGFEAVKEEKAGRRLVQKTLRRRDILILFLASQPSSAVFTPQEVGSTASEHCRLT